MILYSIVSRERLLAAVDSSEANQEQMAKRLRVSSWWVRKLLPEKAETGLIALKPRGARRKPLI